MSKCNVKRDGESGQGGKKEREQITYDIIMKMCMNLVDFTEDISGHHQAEKSQQGAFSAFSRADDQENSAIDTEYNDRYVNMYLFGLIL